MFLEFNGLNLFEAYLIESVSSVTFRSETGFSGGTPVRVGTIGSIFFLDNWKRYY